MPYKLVPQGSGWAVQNSETGKLMSRRPMARQRATAQLRALQRVVTTKPFRSKAQWKWAMATGQDFAHRWAHKTPGGKGKRFRRLPGHIATKDHSGAMVAFMLRPEDAERIFHMVAPLVGANAVPPDEMHVTLAYLGKTVDLAQVPDTGQRIAAGVVNYAVRHIREIGGGDPQGAVVGGVARFMTDEGMGQNAFVLLVNCACLQPAHDALLEELEEQGIHIESEFGFVPHITVAHLPPGSPTPTLTFEPFDVSFDHVTLAWGDVRADFPIAVPETPQGAIIAGKAQRSEGGGGSGEEDGSSSSGRNYHARAGQRIAGNLCRSASGKFGSCGSGGSSKPPTGKLPDIKMKPAKGGKGGKGKGGGGKAKAGGGKGGTGGVKEGKLTPEERAQQQAAEREKATADVYNKLQIPPESRETLEAIGSGDTGKIDAKLAESYKESGLVQQSTDGSYHLTPAGRQVVQAAARGDLGRAGDAIAASRDAIAAANAKQPPAASGGGGGGSKLPKNVQDALGHYKAAGTLTPAERDTLVKAGFVRATVVNGKPTFTLRPKAQAPLMKLKPVKTKELGLSSAPAAFRTFKQKDGKLRWFMLSSNPYKDRDRQHVALKALESDVARTDKVGGLGPLRWWHVGRILWDVPGDWQTVKAGPGIDLGTCDFSAMVGRMLLESGTFHNEAVGAKVAAAAPQLQGSLGFAHPPDEPDASGTYWHIKRFERSLTPQGRASNPFTSFTVKEAPVDKKKMAALKELGLSDEDIADIVGQAQTTQKQADAAGVTFKDDTAALKSQMTEMTQQLAVLTGKLHSLASGESVTVKEGESDVEDVVDEKAAEDLLDGGADDAEEGADDGSGAMYVSDLTTDEFQQLLVDAFQEALGPMHTKLDLEGKMGNALSEMKALIGGVATKEATDLAALQAEVAALSVSLKQANDLIEELTSSQPRALSRGHQPSKDKNNVVPATDPRSVTTKETQKTDAGSNPIAWVDSWVSGQQTQNGVQEIVP